MKFVNNELKRGDKVRFTFEGKIYNLTIKEVWRDGYGNIDLIEFTSGRVWAHVDGEIKDLEVL